MVFRRRLPNAQEDDVKYKDSPCRETGHKQVCEIFSTHDSENSVYNGQQDIVIIWSVSFFNKNDFCESQEDKKSQPIWDQDHD